ncbi:tRNA (N6-threonylcarbamoyladenosine(37)-N6)-methyltransferase TrmO [Desulfomarina sp.]
MNIQITVEAVGVIHSCLKEKFGIPRQPGMAPSATASLELLPPFDREEMVRELENFSHVWVHFYFHRAVEEGWKTTVRPPRLGGKKRVGVFASRSPHRPNYLGMSAVRLTGLRREKGKIFLDLADVDLLDGTPVVDIKPYIPYSDCVTGAGDGYTGNKTAGMEVRFTNEAEEFCARYEQETGRTLRQLIVELVGLDPRPPFQKKSRKEFGMLLWDVNVRWCVCGGYFEIEKLTRYE